MRSLIIFTSLIFLIKIQIISTNPAGGYHDSSVADILKYENFNSGKDGYRYQFDTSDGTSRVETGELKDLGYQSERLSVQGQYIFVDDKGGEHKVDYVADEKGYRAKVRFGTAVKK